MLVLLQNTARNLATAACWPIPAKECHFTATECIWSDGCYKYIASALAMHADFICAAGCRMVPGEAPPAHFICNVNKGLRAFISFTM